MTRQHLYRTVAILGLAANLAACAGKQTIGDSPTVEATVHVCSSCHGPVGRSIGPGFPNLAGQQQDYLVVQLTAFHDHTRADPHAHTYMWGMAAKLDPAAIKELAAFFAKQSPAEPTSGDPVLIAAGRKIFLEGAPDHDVPACQSCHGEKAEGAGEIPRLASQHPDYVAKQLSYFQLNMRNNDTMHETSSKMTQAEMDAVAAYVGSL
jgi:cytochrome c553